MPHYLGYLPGSRREVFRSNVTPTRNNTNARYKSYRGPMPEIAAHYLKYREESGYPALPTNTTASSLASLAEADQDFYWQALRVVLTIPNDKLMCYQQDESLEFNPDSALVT